MFFLLLLPFLLQLLGMVIIRDVAPHATDSPEIMLAIKILLPSPFSLQRFLLLLVDKPGA